MINQVGTPHTIGTNPFVDFTKNQRGYYFITPKNETDTFEPANNKKKRKYTLGFTIGASALVVGFGILALMKGLPKNAYKKLDKLKEFLERKSSKDGKFSRFYEFSLRKLTSFGEKSKGINNIVSIKDMWYKRLTDKWAPLRKFNKGITRMFERFSRRTVVSSYNYMDKKFTGLFKNYKNLNTKLLAENPNDEVLKKTIQEIERRMKNVEGNLDTKFGERARRGRYIKIKHATRTLQEDFVDATFANKNNFKNKDLYQTFWAENRLAPDKINLSKEVNVFRHSITHDVMDNYKAARELVDNISTFVDVKDANARKIIKSVKDNLAIYKKLNGPNEAEMRKTLNIALLKDFKALSEHITKTGSKYNYSADAAKQVASYVEEAQNVLAKSNKGEMQEILTLYKKVLSRKEYLHLKSHTNSAIKSLNKSIDLETNQFFDKHRDLVLGSAPTDVLSIVGSVGAVGYGLAQAKNKDERYSISLKYGIPAVGAIATSLYLAASLVSGGKCMAAGLVSGGIISWLGTKLDDVRKKYIHKQPVQPAPVQTPVVKTVQNTPNAV